MIPDAFYLISAVCLLFCSAFLLAPLLLAAIRRRLAKDSDRFIKSAAQGNVGAPIMHALVITLYALLIALILTPLALGISPLFAVLPVILLALAPTLLTRLFEQARRRRIEEQLPGTIRTIANAVRAGMTVVQAVERCAEEAPEPIRAEFRRIRNRWKLGADLTEAVEETERALHMPSFTLVAAALKVNRDIGGNLPAILAGLADALESGDQCRRELLAATSEGRSTLKILGVAPFVMFALMFVLDPAGSRLVSTTLTGQLIILLGFAPAAIGIFWARKITQVRV